MLDQFNQIVLLRFINSVALYWLQVSCRVWCHDNDFPLITYTVAERLVPCASCWSSAVSMLALLHGESVDASPANIRLSAWVRPQGATARLLTHRDSPAASQTRNKEPLANRAAWRTLPKKPGPRWTSRSLFNISCQRTLNPWSPLEHIRHGATRLITSSSRSLNQRELVFKAGAAFHLPTAEPSWKQPRPSLPGSVSQACLHTKHTPLLPAATIQLHRSRCDS